MTANAYLMGEVAKALTILDQYSEAPYDPVEQLRQAREEIRRFRSIPPPGKTDPADLVELRASIDAMIQDAFARGAHGENLCVRVLTQINEIAKSLMAEGTEGQ